MPGTMYDIRSKRKLLLLCYVGFIRIIMWKQSCYIRRRMSLVLSTEDWKICVCECRQAGYRVELGVYPLVSGKELVGR